MYQELPTAKRKKFEQRALFIDAFRRGEDHLAGVAFFFNLAETCDELNDVVAALEAKGGVIFEASSQRRSDDPKSLRAMFHEACEVYDGKRLSTEEARALGKRRAKDWDCAKPKPGRMPFAEAQVYLNDLSLSVDDALAKINRVSCERVGPKKLKRYPVPWNRDFAYRSRDKKLISFPNRAAGRPRKPRT